jgi:hypothetical protein
VKDNKKTNRDRVLDATKGFTRVIAEQDRVGDVRCSPRDCVIGQSVGRMPGVLDRRIGARSARVLRSDGWHRYDLAPESAAAISVYDRAGEKMPPGFRVVFVPPAKKLGARSGEKPGSNKRSGKRTSVATRTPSTRSMFVEPPAAGTEEKT